MHGDVNTEDLELAEELLEMEVETESYKDFYGPVMCARIFTCCAHDWYELGDDDKGAELLEKANKFCPGYFDNEIKDHIKEDPDFAYLVDSLTEKILAIARSLMA